MTKITRIEIVAFTRTRVVHRAGTARCPTCDATFHTEPLDPDGESGSVGVPILRSLARRVLEAFRRDRPRHAGHDVLDGQTVPRSLPENEGEIE